MSVVIHVFVVLHLLGMAAILAGWTADRLGASQGLVPLVWGARAQLVTGLLLVGLNEMDDQELNHAKIGVKLVVAIAVVACAEIANARSRKAIGTGVGAVVGDGSGAGGAVGIEASGAGTARATGGAGAATIVDAAAALTVLNVLVAVLWTSST